MFSQIIWIISLKLEDASKISMYRSTDLMLTFITQYFFLGIESDYLKILGAVLISAGIVLTMGFKLINDRVDRANKDREKNITHSDGCLKKILFYKF